MTEHPYILPVITLHGTGREALVADLMDAAFAVANAIKALGAAAPNGRDYPDEDVFLEARFLHLKRIKALEAVQSSLRAQAEEISFGE